MKSALAISVNHTIDCQRDVYSQISREVDAVKSEYVKWCGALPQQPKTCVLDAPDNHDILWGLGKNFFLSESTVCM